MSSSLAPNHTLAEEDAHQFSITFHVYYYVPLGILAILCIGGNGIIIRVILKYPKLQTPTNYFLLSLACSDFMHGVVYPIYQVSHIDIPQVYDFFSK